MVALVAVQVWYRTEIRADAIWKVAVTNAGSCVMVVSGLVAWAGRPDSRIGALLVVWGMINLSGGVGDYESGLLLLWSYFNTPLVAVVFVHAFLTYPGGRAVRRPERAFLIAAYAAVSLWIGYALVSYPWWIGDCPRLTCPANPVLIRPELVTAWVLWWSQRAAAVGLALWFATLMVLRVRRM